MYTCGNMVLVRRLSIEGTIADQVMERRKMGENVRKD